MLSLARGQANTESTLNWYILVDGVLTDAFEVGFRILDTTGTPPHGQVFPVVPGDYEDVSFAPGKFGAGSYYVYDNAAALGWIPALSAALGTHRVEWRWKVSALAPYQYGAEDFQVVDMAVGSATNCYISLQDVRDAGLAQTDYPDALVNATIEVWQSFLERACRQWFDARPMTIHCDGTDSDTLHLGVPIISVEYLKINRATTALDESQYRVHNGRGYPDGRRNPRICLVGDEMRDIYAQAIGGGRMKFRRGRSNQEIKGVFGYVEADGGPPPLIKRALLKLVIEKLAHPLYGAPPDPAGAPPPLVGAVLEEWTDSHKIKWAAAGGEVKGRQPGLVGITDDQEVLTIIKLYKAPIGVATPIGDSYGL